MHNCFETCLPALDHTHRLASLAQTHASDQRRCQEAIGKLPLAYFQDLRVEHAQSLLHGSGLDLEAIAAEAGYAEGKALCVLLRKRLKRRVRDLRAGLRRYLACFG